MKESIVVTPSEMEILKRVIGLYIDTGKPVSSRMVKNRYKLTASTANIRKILHELEEKGYLFKPHVSAGRIPSDLGYRLYVDDIKETRPLSRRLVEEVQNKLGQDWSDVGDIMYKTSRLLSEVTHCMGLIMGVFHSHGVVERLSIVQLEGSGGLVVVTLSSGVERKVFIEFRKRYQAHVIDRSVQIINERIAGYPLDEAHQRLEFFMRGSNGTEREITELLAGEADYLFHDSYNLEYYFDGFKGEFDAPEFQNPRILHNLVRIMGEKNLMISIMKARMGEKTMITIGRENILDELEDFTVITKRFSTYDCDGVFGVLGPTRMSYQLVLSLLNTMGLQLQPR